MTRAERKEEGDKKRTWIGRQILEMMESHFKKTRNFSESVQQAQRVARFLIKQKPQEADLVRQACRNIERSFKYYVHQSREKKPTAL